MKKQIVLPPRRGWPVYVDGDTLDALKRIQAQQIGTPSYASIIRQAVEQVDGAKQQKAAK